MKEFLEALVLYLQTACPGEQGRLCDAVGWGKSQVTYLATAWKLIWKKIILCQDLEKESIWEKIGRKVRKQLADLSDHRRKCSKGGGDDWMKKTILVGDVIQ